MPICGCDIGEAHKSLTNPNPCRMGSVGRRSASSCSCLPSPRSAGERGRVRGLPRTLRRRNGGRTPHPSPLPAEPGEAAGAASAPLPGGPGRGDRSCICASPGGPGRGNRSCICLPRGPDPRLPSRDQPSRYRAQRRLYHRQAFFMRSGGAVSGGRKRTTFRCVPAESSSTPWSRASAITYRVSSGAGARVSRSRTSFDRLHGAQSAHLAHQRHLAGDGLHPLADALPQRFGAPVLKPAARGSRGSAGRRRRRNRVAGERPADAGRAGIASVIAARPTTAARGSPPAIDFAIVTRSRLRPTRSDANIVPVRPNPDSNIVADRPDPFQSQNARSAAVKAGGATRKHPSLQDRLDNHRGEIRRSHHGLERLLNRQRRSLRSDTGKGTGAGRSRGRRGRSPLCRAAPCRQGEGEERAPVEAMREAEDAGAPRGWRARS